MVIIDGGPHEFGALAFGEVHPATLSFLENQASYLSHALNDAGRRFMERGLAYLGVPPAPKEPKEDESKQHPALTTPVRSTAMNNAQE